MIALNRNKQQIWFALFTGETEEIDTFGQHTGRFAPTYTAPISTAINVREARGESVLAPNGSETEYSRRLVTCDMDCPLDIDTILWIDIEPYVTEIVGGDPVIRNIPHNYVVSGVAKSINNITYYAKEVNVS